MLLAALAAGCIWIFAYPTHWLRRVDYGTVKVDDEPVTADIFFGNPDGEADAIVLVHLKDGRDYFLDFGTEEWRQGGGSEYLRLIGGVWSFPSLRDHSRREEEPLPFRNLNEFRIPASDGHEVSIQF